jgi:uncharacterized protein YdaU (DUF1376 family)
MSNNFPYYRWFPKDYSGDAQVQAMDDDQDLAYRRLLDKSWEIGPLPIEVEKLAAYARYALARFEQCWRFPLIDCWCEVDGKLINQRLEDERDFATSRALNALKASNCRWKKRAKRLKSKRVKKGKRGECDRNAGAMLPQCDLDAINRSSTSATVRDISTTKIQSKTEKDRDLKIIKPGKHIEVKWDSKGGPKKEGSFIGERERLRTYLLNRFGEEFGEKWIQAQWKSIVEWCQDNEEKILKKKNCYAFIQTWYRNAAKQKREWAK